MRARILNLYVLVCSLIFSAGLFAEFSRAIKGYWGYVFEPGLARGITGNAVFYGIGKGYDAFVYYSSIVFVPATALLLYFFFFHYPSKRLSGGSLRKELLLRRVMGVPMSFWLFAVPGLGFRREAFLLAAALFLAVFSFAIFACRRFPHGRLLRVLFPTVVASSVLVSFFTAPKAGPAVITLAIACLAGFFWSYQSGAGIGTLRLLFVAGLVLMVPGALLSEREERVLLPLFLFFAFPALYLVLPGAKTRLKSQKIPLKYHFAFLFYGWSLGVFLFSGMVAAALSAVIFWALLSAILRVAGAAADGARKTVFSLSPLALLHLKAPLYITLFGRYGDGGAAFAALFLSSVAVLSALAFIAASKTGVFGKESSERALFFFASLIVVYSSLFNPSLDGKFDVYHEAENIAMASLYLNGGYGLKDLYFVEHGLIHDLGIGVGAVKLFGETLEGLRSLLMYINPVAGVAFFILCWSLMGRASLGLAAFVSAVAMVLAFNAGNPVLHRGFLRLLAPALGLASFSLYTRKGKRVYLVLSSVFSFIGVLWSIDTGIFFLSALTFSILMLDFKKSGLRPGRAFPLHMAVLLALFLLAFLVEKDFFSAYADVISRQATVVQVNAHAVAYPAFSASQTGNFYVSFVNPAIIVFSITVILWLLLNRKWEERDFSLLALSLFSAAFFTRAIHRSDVGHLTFASFFVPVLFALSIERLSEMHLGRRLFRYLPVVTAAFGVFMLSPYNAWKNSLFPAHTQKKAVYGKTGQVLSTDKVGDITIDPYQADGINWLIDFLEKEKKGARVFDFTNNYGITYWLLGERPITRSLFIAHENTVREQESVVKRLGEERPEFVLFNSNDFFSRFDGFANSTRHPVVASYILENYRPYARLLNYEVLARKDYSANLSEKPGGSRIFSHRAVDGKVEKGAVEKGIEIKLPREVNSHTGRFISLLMKVERMGDDPPYETSGIMLNNREGVAALSVPSTASRGAMTPYQFRLKDSPDFVRYRIPLPDGDLKTLVLIPANFQCSFKIKELDVYASPASQYPGTLREWDLFEAADLGLIPYYRGKARPGGPDKEAAGHELSESGEIETGGLDTRHISRMVLEVKGESPKGAVFWDTGHGFFKDQAVYFSTREGLNRYDIDLSSVPSWRYSGPVRRLRVAPVDERLSPVDSRLELRDLVFYSAP